jgi:diguanylate cyclase (GGDEF)-like protein
VSHGSPLLRHGLLRRVWPFALALLVAFASLPFVAISNSGLVVAAAALAVVIAIAALGVPWERVPASLAALPPLAVIAVAFLLRHGTGGLHNPVDYEALLMLPVLWLALYGSRTEMLIAVALGGLSFAVSIAIQPAGNGAWLKAAIWPTVTALVGARVQTLVGEVRRLSQTDHLTGVANRAQWDNELARETARAERSRLPLSVALIDIDHFKLINDEHGHRAGDDLLQTAASAWRKVLRVTDLIARYGGDEFGLLLLDTDLDAAREVIDRMRRSTTGSISFSAGIAQRRAGEPTHELLARADAALYAAKRAGRGRVHAGAP